ncbi:MAG: hypothetical protein RL477_2225, partial [Pseudomonadota bacterium]
GRAGRIAGIALALLLAASLVVPLVWIIANMDYLMAGRMQFVSEVEPVELLLGCALIVGLFELCRRATGIALPAVALVFLAFPFLPGLPGLLRHNGYSLGEVIEVQVLTTAGIYGVPLAASASYIVLFIIFGAFLERSGLGKFMMDFSIGLVGRFRGGPAKVAVISSAMTGTISGSATANVLTVGTITIPLMKRTGYPAFMAGAIEAAASTGGALMPPVMGTVAFVMSEFSGIPYSQIIVYAAIPAILYYVGIFLTVHFAAIRYGARGMTREEMPDWRAQVRGRWHLLIPILLLVVLMEKDYSPQFAAVYSIVAVVAVSWLRKDTRMGWREVFDALEIGAKGALLVAVATAAAGVIVGVFELTSVGVKLAQQGTSLAGSLMVGLIITMIVSIILGLGVPPTISYIAQIAVTIPMIKVFLTNGGVDPAIANAAAHLFVVYYSTLAVLTPPDALAAVAACGIAGSSFMKTALHATRTAFVAFIVPFMFVYRPALLTFGAWQEVVYAVAISLAGIAALAAAFEGYALRRLTPIERMLAFVAGLALVVPDPLLDAIGLGLVAVLAAVQFLGRGKAA